jgi:hypothetical protein
MHWPSGNGVRLADRTAQFPAVVACWPQVTATGVVGLGDGAGKDDGLGLGLGVGVGVADGLGFGVGEPLGDVRG